MAKVKISSGNTFERQEKKYLLNALQHQNLMKIINLTMELDEHGLHTISTIYYDTEDYAIIRHSLDKPSFKEKLRLRSYGIPADDTTVFLELKKKIGGITHKRRIPLLLKEANQFLHTGIMPNDPSQIFKEIHWFIGQYHPTPKALISYDRLAFFGKEDSDFRITFDKNVRWRKENLKLSSGDYGAPLITKEETLMEIKTLNALPYDFSRQLSTLGIYPTSFSKYGTVYTQYLKNKEIIEYVG